MKKVLAMILALVMALSLVACSNGGTDKPEAAGSHVPVQAGHHGLGSFEDQPQQGHHGVGRGRTTRGLAEIGSRAEDRSGVGQLDGPDRGIA